MSDNDIDIDQNQKLIDALLEENEVLHHIIHRTRQQVISIFMAFIHMSADDAQMPPSWLLSYVVNDDRDVLECNTMDEWPLGYEDNVKEFCEMMSYYNGEECESLPVKVVVRDMITWPSGSKLKKILH
ncbi:MAG: hypothetical protein GY804_03970 [Alphaproteobacteria bacterium]|nr:hypothetical protein [Alphaproteobacteria bacterium]